MGVETHWMEISCHFCLLNGPGTKTESTRLTLTCKVLLLQVRSNRDGRVVERR
jgi:hypothetical protein